MFHLLILYVEELPFTKDTIIVVTIKYFSYNNLNKCLSITDSPAVKRNLEAEAKHDISAGGNADLLFQISALIYPVPVPAISPPAPVPFVTLRAIPKYMWERSV